jgi:hypothetical protein
MFKRMHQKTLFLIFMAILSISGLKLSDANEKRDMGGWEKNSPYNKLYNAAELDSFKGTVTGIKKIVPLPGMSPGIAIVVRESKTESVLVHLCPSWFADRKNIGIKKGDRVKVKGVWAEIKGKDVFMASKVKRGNLFSLKVRLTKDGTPFWTMSPEQLAKEKAKN